MKTRLVSVVTFGRNGNAQSYEGSGWSAGEGGFTWTIGVESRIRLPAPHAPNGFVLELHIDPFIKEPAAPVQRLKVFVGSHIAANLVLTSGGYFAVLVPLKCEGVDFVDLTFLHQNAIAAGDREVAFAFRTIRFFILEDSPRICQPPPRAAMASIDSSSPIDQVTMLCGATIREIVTSFEMLSGNCEFGGIQRRCGAEPLSLLRFAGASPSAAILGLDTLFEGIGEEIEPWIVQNGIQEWMIRDTRYNLNYHTITSSNKVSRERIVALEKKKVRFLREKFIEDLTAGEKIFIYADRLEATEQQGVALFLALRRRSTSPLLWIQAAPRSEMTGRPHFIMPGLLRCYIDRFAPPHDGTDVSLSGWLTVLANAWPLLRRPMENSRDF